MNNNNGWIPVKRLLPKIGEPFDAWINGKRVADCGAYVGYWDDVDRRETMLIKGITHWKPISEGPLTDYKPCDQLDSNGSCPHPNVHCAYPRCEQIPFETKSIVTP